MSGDQIEQTTIEPDGDITLCDRTPSMALDVLGNEHIVGVALRWNDKLIISLPRPSRHADIFKEFYPLTEDSWPNNLTQGFVTSTGRFVGRQEGRVIAETAGQAKKQRVPGGELYSEDVW